MAEYLDVLVLCADPVNLLRTLNLAQELVHFEHVIRSAGLPVRLRRVTPPTLEQLTREFTLAERWGRRPAVFHFLGHGDDDGLYFETEHGEYELVKGHQLRSVLAESPVDLVLLNACWSATRRGVSLCDFLTREQVARAAIGHERPVADASAIEFARQFYALITQGLTVRDACQHAANALAEQGQPGAAEMKLVGDGAFCLTDGLPAGQRASVVESGLPADGHLPEAGAFYGRGEELVQISRALADARLAGFALWGIGGIGKTALARVFARRNAWRYRGAVWVDIRDATQKTTAELLRLVLCRLHPGAPDSDPAFELTRRLQNAPSLIVLDNLEDLPEAEHAALARFIDQMPRNGSHVLLTARVTLPAVERLPAVRSRRMTEGLDPRNGAYYVRHVASQKDCRALLDDGQLREENGQLVGLCVQVARRLHGHPKMLELAVGVALQGRAALEQTLVALPDELEQQLAAMLATSLQYLGPDGQRALPLLGFFPTGTATPEALEVVARVTGDSQATPTTPDSAASDMADDSDDEPDLSWLARGRAQLLNAGLLDYDQTQDVVTFHQSILDEASRRQPADETCGAATVALLMHYAAYLRDNLADNERLDRCVEAALVLMESIWSGREQEGPVDAVLADMTRSLGNYLRDRGLWRIAEQWYERAIELRRSSSYARDDVALALQYFHQGQILTAHSHPASAQHAFKEALRLWQEAGVDRGIGVVLFELAKIEASRGDRREARRLLHESMTIAHSLGEQSGLAALLIELAHVEESVGNLTEARRLLGRSMDISDRLGDRRSLATSFYQLAIIESHEGNLHEARRLLQRSLEVNQSLGHLSSVAASLRELACIEHRQGNPSEARRLLQRSLKILERLEDQAGLAASLHMLAVVESDQRQPTEARALLQRSQAILESLGDQRGLAASLHMLAMIESDQGKPSEARRVLQRSMGIHESLGDQLGFASSLHQLAILESAQGNLSAARCLLQRSLALRETLGNRSGLASSLHELANIEFTLGHSDEARPLWERSIEIAESISDPVGAARTRMMLAQLETLDGRFPRALELATTAVQELEQVGNADAEQARGVLRWVEESAAQGVAPQGAGASYLDRLKQLIAAWQSLSSDQRAERLAGFEASEPVEAVLGWLAHGAVSWQEGDVPACDAALDTARTIAQACGDGELLGLVDALSEQLVAADPAAEGSGPDVLSAAVNLLKHGDAAGATELLDQVLALAREAGNRLAEATCLFYLGQAHLLSGRAADAVAALRKALDLATEADDPALIRAAQQVLTIAVQEGKASENG